MKTFIPHVPSYVPGPRGNCNGAKRDGICPISAEKQPVLVLSLCSFGPPIKNTLPCRHTSHTQGALIAAFRSNDNVTFAYAMRSEGQLILPVHAVTLRPGAFGSQDAGQVGFIDGGCFHILNAHGFGTHKRG